MDNIYTIFDKYKYRITNKMIYLSKDVIDKINYIHKTVINAEELEAIQSSKIEGYYSTQAQLHDSTNNTEGVRKVRANVTALKMIKNMSEHDRITKYDIFRLSSLFQEKDINEYRQIGINVVSSITGEVVHSGCDPTLLKDKMNNFIDYYNQNDNSYSLYEKLWKSIIIHYIFVEIHPFEDGNGRLARTLQYKYLIDKVDKSFERFSISYAGKDLLPKYYKSLQKVESLNFDITCFIEVALELILASIERVTILDTMTDTIVKIKNYEDFIRTEYNSLPEDLKSKYDILLRVFKEIPKLFLKVSNKDYRISLNKLSKVLDIESGEIKSVLNSKISLLELAHLNLDDKYLIFNYFDK